MNLTFAAASLGPRRVSLEAGLRDTMGSIRGRLGACGIANGRDMYICHNGKLLGDDSVLANLEFSEYRGLSEEKDHLVRQ